MVLEVALEMAVRAVAEGVASVPELSLAAYTSLASPLVDLESPSAVFEGRSLEKDVPPALDRILAERGLDEASLPGCEVHERRLTLPARVEVGGIASLRLGTDGYRGGDTELWLECLPSGHLPMRLLDVPT